VDKPVALITGASSGIGTAFAWKLAARGYNLILLARRADRLQTLAGELPVAVETLQADLSTEAGIAGAERAIHERPRLDLLVNNAGFGTLRRFWEAPVEGQTRMHELHVMAIMRLTHAALARMVPYGRGGIINVSSVAAFGQSPGNVSYCATKAWINSFTEGLAIELANANSPVKVQALCPGFTATEFHETLGLITGDSTGGIPRFLWTEADDVVNASLHGFDRGKVIVIPGWKYKTVATVMKHLPWSIRRRASRPGGSRI